MGIFVLAQLGVCAAGFLNSMETHSSIFAPLPQIETAMKASLQSVALPPALHDAFAYAALDGGKRLRPLLAWHSAVAAGAPGEASLPAATALELVHCFSLVHDDLPALDNDDLRRGKPTLHKHAGEAMAILAGDGLLTLAFSLLSRVQPSALAAQLAMDLSEATLAMIAGQAGDTMRDLPHDVRAQGDLASLRWIHKHKTGALLRASCVMGARLGFAHSGVGAPAQLAKLADFADAAGVLFQAVDDLLDVTQTSEHTGKRTGKDDHAGKLTYPRVLGIDGTKAEIARLEDLAKTSLTSFGAKAEGLRGLLAFLATRTK